MTPLEVATMSLGATDPEPFWAVIWPNRPVDAVNWCGCFVSWCFTTAGTPLPKWEQTTTSGFVYCPDALPHFTAADPQSGDIVLYCWDGSGNPEHTGIVETVNADGTITAIEGNTGDPPGVCRETRDRSLCVAFYHPPEAAVARLMYDDVSIGNYPRDAQMAAGYVDGRWQTFWGLGVQCPQAFLVSITVLGGDADVCDCESGDLTPNQAAAWVQSRKQAGKRAIVYCSFSDWAAVRGACAALGVTPDGYWIADYDGNPVIPADWQEMRCVAKQYQSTDTYDLSIVLDTWPGLPTPSTPAGDDDMPKLISCVDEISGGAWTVATADGGIFTDDGAPFLGAFPGHPEWKAIDADHPIVAIQFWRGDGTNGGGNGYRVGEYDPNPPAGHGPIRWYRFPRDGRYAH